MKVNFKSPFLLVSAAALCLAVSCGAKDGSDNNSSEESAELETIGTETGLMEDAMEDAMEAAPAVGTSSVSSSSSKVFSSEPIKGRGQWDATNKMYNDDPRHLFWDLSFYNSWHTFAESKLPKTVQLVVENEDNQVLAALMAYPLVDKLVTSVWELPKEAVLEQVMAMQNKLFKLSENQEPIVTKVTFRDKNAYEIKFNANVPDQRSGTRVYREYKIRTVVMVADHEMIELFVMAPPEALKRFGDDTFTFLIGKFNFL